MGVHGGNNAFGLMQNGNRRGCGGKHRRGPGGECGGAACTVPARAVERARRRDGRRAVKVSSTHRLGTEALPFQLTLSVVTSGDDDAPLSSGAVVNYEDLVQRCVCKGAEAVGVCPCTETDGGRAVAHRAPQGVQGGDWAAGADTPLQAPGVAERGGFEQPADARPRRHRQPCEPTPHTHACMHTRRRMHIYTEETRTCIAIPMLVCPGAPTRSGWGWGLSGNALLKNKTSALSSMLLGDRDVPAAEARRQTERWIPVPRVPLWRRQGPGRLLCCLCAPRHAAVCADDVIAWRARGGGRRGAGCDGRVRGAGAGAGR
jgi:hypothetical protein